MSGKDAARKVCFVTGFYPPNTFGGAAKSAERIVRYLAEDGFDIHVVTAYWRDLGTGLNRRVPEFEEGKSLCDNGIYIHPVAIKDRAKENPSQSVGVANRDFYQTILRLDNEISFDIFHGFLVPMAYPCLLVSGRSRRPVIASIRGHEVEDWALQSWGLPFMTAVLQRASWITSVGTELLDVPSALADIEDRSSFIPNAIDSSTFPEWRPVDNTHGVVGTVGRFSDYKDIPNLVHAYARVRTEVRSKLLLVGDFPDPMEGRVGEESRVKRVIEDHAIESEVEITGFVEDRKKILEYLLSMQVFVVSSVIDGLPNALLEAASVGVPLVATGVGGLKDILKDGESALIVPPKDPKKLSDAIERVLKDKRLAQRLSQGALKMAKALSPANEKKVWTELYHRLLKCAK